jgi:hypothetical protein
VYYLSHAEKKSIHLCEGSTLAASRSEATVTESKCRESILRLPANLHDRTVVFLLIQMHHEHSLHLAIHSNIFARVSSRRPGYIKRQLRAADCSENSPCVKLM